MKDCNNCKVKHTDYDSDNIYTWCTNCGNYGIHGALKLALVELEIPKRDVLLCFDIGCNGNGSDKIDGYRVHGLHGRVIPFAAGASIANNNVKVIASGGDGGTLGEGVNHLIHAVRSNYNITFLLHNNQNYGLTTGQASSTTPVDVPMHASEDGVTATPLHVAQFLLSLQPSFYARAYSGYVGQLTQILKEAINHQGFSFVEILQDCPTYNKATPHDWYLQRIFTVDSIPNYDRTDLFAAMAISRDLDHRIATGVLFQDHTVTPFDKRLKNRETTKSELVDEVKNYDPTPYLNQFI